MVFLTHKSLCDRGFEKSNLRGLSKEKNAVDLYLVHHPISPQLQVRIPAARQGRAHALITMACSQSRQKATAVAALLCLSVIAVSLVGGGLHSSLSPAKIFSSRRGCLHAPHPCNRYPPHYYCCGESWLSSAWNSVRHRCSKDAASHLSRARGSSQVEASGRNGLRPVESGRDRRRRLNEADEVEEKQQQDEGAQGRKKARLAILILSDGEDIDRLHLMLPQIYDPDNIYLVHVDAKTPPEKVRIGGVVLRQLLCVPRSPRVRMLLHVLLFGKF